MSRLERPVASEPRDLSVLSGELVPGLDAAFADPLAGGQKLALGRAANALTPIAVNISNAVRSCSRPSVRPRSRRSHSP